MMRAILALFLVAGFVLSPAQAQDSPPEIPLFGRHMVFVQSDIDDAGSDQLLFVDLLTGETTTSQANGERYLPVHDAVLFYDRSAARVKLAFPNGEIRDHRFMQPTATARRIDWELSADGEWLAWTITEGDPAALITTTTIATIDGENAQIALVDGPRDGLRALPVGFSPDGRTLYMDYQPDTIGNLTPFRQYAGLFALDLDTSTTIMMPNEPGCFCGAGVQANKFMRLALTGDLNGFDLNVYDLIEGTTATIRALALVNFTQAGDVLIAPDGTKAVYALAQVENLGTPEQFVRTVFVLVDLIDGTQTPLTDPITTFVRPITWTEENSAVLFTSPSRDGTWKVSLGDGSLQKVADATYIGILR